MAPAPAKKGGSGNPGVIPNTATNVLVPDHTFATKAYLEIIKTPTPL